MNTPRRLIFAPALAILITASSLSAIAQTKKSESSKKSSATAKKETSKHHRLPTYYGQIKLKEEQVAEIYSIKDSFGKKIEDLEAELAKLKEEQAKKIKGVLTKTQIAALNKLVEGAAPKSKAMKPSTAKKTTAKKSESSKSSTKKSK